MMLPADWCAQLGLWWVGLAAHPDDIARILERPRNALCPLGGVPRRAGALPCASTFTSASASASRDCYAAAVPAAARAGPDHLRAA